MNTTHAEAPDTVSASINSLTALFDSSEALAAANRLYEQNRSGLRFFCENRRVVTVDEAQEMTADGEAVGVAALASA